MARSADSPAFSTRDSSDPCDPHHEVIKNARPELISDRAFCLVKPGAALGIRTPDPFITRHIQAH